MGKNNKSNNNNQPTEQGMRIQAQPIPVMGSLGLARRDSVGKVKVKTLRAISRWFLLMDLIYLSGFGCSWCGMTKSSNPRAGGLTRCCVPFVFMELR